MFRSRLFKYTAITSSLLAGRSITIASADAAVKTPPSHYDLLVIGGGSGGLACAKRAAGYGATVGIIEAERYGGTCVNVGCVPKKVMYNASHVAETIHEAHNFGFKVGETTFDWAELKRYRDRYIERLNRIYETGLDKTNVHRIAGFGQITDSKTVRVGEQNYTANHIVIAVGGEPNKLGVPGEEHVIDSNKFFELPKQPKKVAIIGAGYIAVELAGVFNGLGTDTTLFVRKNMALREFDITLATYLDTSMKKSGIKVQNNSVVKEVVKEVDGTLTLHLQNGEIHRGYEVILAATGRHPKTSSLGLSNVGVQKTPEGYINVDEFQNTNVPGIYALGDVCGKVELTPMAIAAGRRLSDRLFGGVPNAKVDYTNVPTVVFSHPVIGTIGLTEQQARELYPESELKIYNSTFVNLYYGTFLRGEGGDKPLSKYKLICLGKDEKVIGLHAIGMGSDEMLQGFGVAMRMGATKADFDRCVAIHPTAAEEMVTMPPWGTLPKSFE